MKVLKTILLVIVMFIVVVLITALFVKKEYTVQRGITINKQKQVVFDYISHIKNQDYFSKWVMTDPNMKKDFKGTDGTVGFVYAWDSQNKKAGKGEQEIKSITEGQRIDMEVRFIKPFEGMANVHMITDSLSANQTKVTWGMEGKSAYPMNVMNLFIDKMLGKDMDSSLVMLKNNLEK
jgi:hypothetical protein